MFSSIPRTLFSLSLLLTTPVCVSAIVWVPVNSWPSNPLPVDQCPAGDLQCCNALERASDTTAGQILGHLGIVIQDLDVLLGITCSPIDILGISQNECHTQAVCCENNSLSGIVAINCVPISINL